jgi:hypothetical protein
MGTIPLLLIANNTNNPQQVNEYSSAAMFYPKKPANYSGFDPTGDAMTIASCAYLLKIHS